MLQKLASLLLSLLLCLSLLPGQARGISADPFEPPVAVEPPDPNDPGEPEPPEEPAAPMGTVPGDETDYHTS